MLVKRVSNLKLKANKLQSLNSSVADYSSTLGIQSDRLSGLGWFEKHIGKSNACPFCNSTTDVAKQKVNELNDLSRQLQNEIHSIISTPSILDKERININSRIRDVEEELRQIRIRKRASEGNKDQHITENIYKYIGKIEQVIETLTTDEIDGTDVFIEDLETQLAKINAFLKGYDAESRETHALAINSRYISEFASFMGLARASDVIEIKIKDLNITFSSPNSSKKDYLWEVGSGQN